ncbi:MAG: DUF3322 domain-containing protein [Chthoniobacteraceae bacterium]
MRLPDDIRQQLARRFELNHRGWLIERKAGGSWPLEIGLGIPSEKAALRQPEGVRAWVAHWRAWKGAGSVVWCARRWLTLGTQELPEKIVLEKPGEVAAWAGQSDYWNRLQARYRVLIERWPVLEHNVPGHLDAWVNCREADFERLLDTLSWILAHPASQLYPRQLPIAGIDSKWMEARKGLLTDLVGRIRGICTNGEDFFQRCGLKPLPATVRMRVLDPKLRALLRGLGDITALWDELAALHLPAKRVFIVENLQTALAFPEIPGGVVFMALGYSVDGLGCLPWVREACCFYFGDLDSHGFAILNRARTYFPDLRSLLMDEETLLTHRALWGEEKEPCRAETLPMLTPDEQAVYQGIRHHRWSQNLRLEQERLDWDYVTKAISMAIA